MTETRAVGERGLVPHILLFLAAMTVVVPFLWVAAAGFRTYCALPLRHRGETVAVLGVPTIKKSVHLPREMILDKRPTSEIKRLAREEGMTFLRESALAKAKAGVTTLREINKVTFIE